MSGRNSQRTGKIGEAVCGRAVLTVGKNRGYNVYQSSDKIEDMSIENCKQEDIDFALDIDELGSLILDDMQTKFGINKDFDKYTLSCEDVSSDVANKKTADLLVSIENNLTNEIYAVKFSQKTKSKTGNRMDGTNSNTNRKFLKNIFEGTPLLDEEVLKIANTDNDEAFREEIKKIKKEQGCTIDRASHLVNMNHDYQGGKHGNKSNNQCWKKISSAALQEAVLYTLNKPEFAVYKQRVIRNILNLAGYKFDTHLCLALRTKGKTETTFYSSLNCDKYNEINNNNFEELKIVTKPGNVFHIELNNMKITLDYAPKGIVLSTNPRQVLIKGNGVIKRRKNESVISF